MITFFVINNRYFIECLMSQTLKCFTGIHFATSVTSAIIVLILRMRKLRPERLRNLPKTHSRWKSQVQTQAIWLQCSRDPWALDKKWEVLDSCSSLIVFCLITVSVEVAICLLHCFPRSAQLWSPGLHTTFPIFLSTESHRDEKIGKPSSCDLTLLFQL